jgi:hypothetical protein
METAANNECVRHCYQYRDQCIRNLRIDRRKVYQEILRYHTPLPLNPESAITEEKEKVRHRIC